MEPPKKAVRPSEDEKAAPSALAVAEAKIITLIEKLANANDEIQKLKGRKEVFVLATSMPLEPRGDQKPHIDIHPELGFWFEQHEAEKGMKNRPLKVICLRRAE
jgi:hypothetical protein